MLFVLRLLRLAFPILLLFFGFKVLAAILRQARINAGGAYRRAWNEGHENGGNSSTGSRHSFRDPYQVMGLSRSADVETIKKRYKELVAKYHPDRFIGQDFDEEFIDLATKKFQDIQAAYEEIRKERRF